MHLQAHPPQVGGSFFAYNMKTYIIDFEFNHPPGERPKPWCVAWHCVETGEEGKLWIDGLRVESPFPARFRMVAHYAMAELVCFITLRWPLPDEVIDTLPEARAIRGQIKPAGGGWGLLSVAQMCGAPTMCYEHKDSMRFLALQDEVPDDKREELMAYCLDDVKACLAIWECLNPQMAMPEALFRGRYLKALARVESRGIPTDTDLIRRLEASTDKIRENIWTRAREAYQGVINGADNFVNAGWLKWCDREGIPWPLLPSGQARLDADTFKEMGDRYPAVRTMAYAKKLRGQLRGYQFPVGKDGRLRCMLSPFGSDTGRNQPSNSNFIFGASAWLRSVVAAPAGKVLAYVDFSAQEPALAGYLSKDQAMMADYRSGDPYMAFAKRAGAVPEGATKVTHADERATYKVAALAVQYGMREESLAKKLGIPVSAARRLITQHQASYPTYWNWRQAVIDTVMCGEPVSTIYGWRRKSRSDDSGTSIANFPVQAAGAEILRIAIIALEEAGHRVIAPVHDAVLVEMDEDGWEKELAEIRHLMSRAAASVAPGIEIPTDVDLVFPGQNYMDKRGQEFWDLVARIIGRGPVTD